MDGRCARFFEAAYHVHDVEHFAITGIAIDQNREPGGPRNLPHEKTDFINGDDPEVRQAHAGAHGGTGKVERLKSRLCRLTGSKAVMGTGHLNDPRPGEQLPQPLTWPELSLVGIGEIDHPILSVM